MRFFLALPVVCTLPLLGCGSGIPDTAMEGAVFAPAAKSAVPSPPSESPAAPSASEVGFAGMMTPNAPGRMMTGMMGMGAVAVQPSAAAPAEAPPAVSRKVIYDAVLDLTVDSVEPASRRVPELVEDVKGYISEQNTTGSPGTKRSEHWKIRIPVERFDFFVESVKPLGELATFSRTSQDVTAEFYDVEARIKNKKVEEQTLVKILDERSGQLDDVLKIEVELSRVRGEIEQMQGRIRVLENLSSLATLTLNVNEREKFTPAAPVVADFPTKVARTWQASVQSLVEMGEGLTLFAVSWAIWTPFLVVLAVVCRTLLRRLLPIMRRLAGVDVSLRPASRPPSGE